ncbi:hypothetical protein MMC10_009458 [Thelotrema lepadinum]|nr:hypothetical protein [Thelotrema lepadinum]
MAVFRAPTPDFDQFFDFDKDTQPEVQSFGNSPTLQPWNPESSTSDSVFEWPSSPFSFSSLPPTSCYLKDDSVPLLDLEALIDPINSKVQHGQLTPRSSTLTPPSPYRQDVGPKHEKQRNETWDKKEHTVPQKPSRRRNRKPQTKETVDLKSAGGIEKRVRFLERNRVAASKCRQKRREWMGGLETEVQKLQQTKEILTNLTDILREEVNFLTGELYRHASCQSAQINAHIQSQHGDISACEDRYFDCQPKATGDDDSSSCCSCPESPLDHGVEASSTAHAASAISTPVSEASNAKPLTDNEVKALLMCDIMEDMGAAIEL